ncbi:MAG: class I poly(R)-hydroxyalkanoic acid synthase, partial [Pacificimonas sp.]
MPEKTGADTKEAMGALGKDPAETFERMTYLAGKSQQMMIDFWAKQEPKADAPTNLDPFGMMDLWSGMAQAAMSDPMKLAQMQTDFVQESARLWQGLLGGETGDGSTPKRDRRFQGETWQELPAFGFIREAYLLASRYIMESVGALDGLDGKDRDKALFYTQQFVDAMSPSNYLLTNPEVLKQTVESGGENLLKGTEHLLRDLENGRMRMT